MCLVFNIKERTFVSLNDVDAEIDRLLMSVPSRVADAARYHFSAGGARVRAQLGIDAAAALGLAPMAAMSCALAPELLHNASLVHDDLQDGDQVRRGRPAVWSRYGKDIAISTGDLLISAAYVAVANHPQPALALLAIHNAVAVTIAGQTQDCSAGQSTPDACAQISAQKSGPLLALPIRLALIAAEAPGQDIAVRTGTALAIAYQTLDDIMDRDRDLANGATNICLSFEGAGHTPASAKATARDRAFAALRTAREDANAIPGGAGVPFLALADHLESKLKDINHAT
jgi:geranylgeranyl pyrophosphate synthase